jgi:general secretion pathway protein M
MSGAGIFSWPGRWLASLALRERRMVVWGGGVVAAVLVETLVIEPGLEWLGSRRRMVEEKSATLAWMKDSAREVARLKGAGAGSGTGTARSKTGAGGSGGESLLALVDRLAKEKGLAGALRRVEPEGNGRVRAGFEKVNFGGLMGWLSDLESRYGVNVENLTLDREEEAGLVRARVVLSWPGRGGASREAGRTMGGAVGPNESRPPGTAR